MSAYSQAGSTAASSFAPTGTASCPKFNCITVPALKSNPDISGIGVLLGFAISAYLTLFFCAAYYYINLDGVSNPVDRLFLEIFFPESTKNVSRKWSEALQSAVLALGDSQVVTGVSILVSGYIQLACGLQYYHWLIVVDLAFFSSITHLTSLTCLRSYLEKRPAIRIWRLICMGVTAVLLAVALGSTGYYNVQYEWPAQCFLTHNFASLEDPIEEGLGIGLEGTYAYDGVYMAIILCFLSFSYISRVVQLFPSIQPAMRHLLRTRPSSAIQSWLLSVKNRASASSRKSTSKFWLLAHGILLSFYCLSEAVADLYGSLLWEITWLGLASAWGTIVVWRDRGHRYYLLGFSSTEQMTLSEDNTWGFGQVFPLVLLVLPLVSFFEAVYETVFEPASTPPNSPQDLNIAMLIQAPERVSNSFYSAVPHISNQSNTNLLVPGHTQSYHDFYQYPWFRRLIVLIYGFTLALAGNVLWFFPFAGFSTDIQGGFVNLIQYMPPGSHITLALR